MSSVKPQNLLAGPIARIALAGILLVIAVAAALGVSMWRYEASAAKYRHALVIAESSARSTGDARSMRRALGDLTSCACG
jgi:hypothetical protein